MNTEYVWAIHLAKQRRQCREQFTRSKYDSHWQWCLPWQSRSCALHVSQSEHATKLVTPINSHRTQHHAMWKQSNITTWWPRLLSKGLTEMLLQKSSMSHNATMRARTITSGTSMLSWKTATAVSSNWTKRCKRNYDQSSVNLKWTGRSINNCWDRLRWFSLTMEISALIRTVNTAKCWRTSELRVGR